MEKQFGKFWYACFSFINIKDIESLTVLKIDVRNHIFVKNEIYKVTIIFPPRVTPVGFHLTWCGYFGMTFVKRS